MQLRDKENNDIFTFLIKMQEESQEVQEKILENHSSISNTPESKIRDRTTFFVPGCIGPDFFSKFLIYIYILFQHQDKHFYLKLYYGKTRVLYDNKNKCMK